MKKELILALVLGLVVVLFGVHFQIEIGDIRGTLERIENSIAGGLTPPRDSTATVATTGTVFTPPATKVEARKPEIIDVPLGQVVHVWLEPGQRTPFYSWAPGRESVIEPPENVEVRFFSINGRDGPFHVTRGTSADEETKPLSGLRQNYIAFELGDGVAGRYLLKLGY